MARFGLRRVGARSAPERRRHRSCGCAAYAPFELQDRHDGDAGGKTSEVGEVRDVRGLVADDAEDVERRDQLQQQPFAEDENGGQGHRSDEQTHGDQYAHSPGRYQGQVRAKDPGDRSGRTDQMRRTEDRVLDESLGDRRDTTGKEREDQERDGTHPLVRVWRRRSKASRLRSSKKPIASKSAPAIANVAKLGIRFTTSKMPRSASIPIIPIAGMICHRRRKPSPASVRTTSCAIRIACWTAAAGVNVRRKVGNRYSQTPSASNAVENAAGSPPRRNRGNAIASANKMVPAATPGIWSRSGNRTMTVLSIVSTASAAALIHRSPSRPAATRTPSPAATTSAVAVNVGCVIESPRLGSNRTPTPRAPSTACSRRVRP